MLKKTCHNATNHYKNGFYLRSLSIKTDFSNYRKHYKEWHPRYFDVVRRTEFQKNTKDYKTLTFNTQDPLFFDNKFDNVNGGFAMVLKRVLAEKDEKTTYSVYRCIYLMFQMAKNNLFETGFFDELDSQMNPSNLDISHLHVRQIYGALYAYYKFGRGKPENIMFFENALEINPTVMHIEMSIKLFEMIFETSVIESDRLDLFLTNFFLPNFLTNWDLQVKFKQRLVKEFHRVLMKLKFVNEFLWENLIETTLSFKRVQNLDNYLTMLEGLNWYNSYPKSPKFQKLNKEIETFKDQVRKNENRNWRIDVDNGKWRDFSELLKSREEIDKDSFVFAYISSKKSIVKEKEVEKKVTYSFEEIKKMIKEKIDKRFSVHTIREHLIGLPGVTVDQIDDAFTEIIKEEQNKTVSDLKKKGEFTAEMTQEQLKESQAKRAQKAATGAPKKKEETGGKKKK